ncbi:MAG TPA: DUF4124 domain-containing protein [Gammaproteobacteria bacterium]|nr:DUF4124 domain-containing protein [Gammaproteobacteria bacterium]
MAMRTPSSPLLALAAVLLCGAWGSALGATAYKWTDDQGVVHYGDEPPSGKGHQVEKLQLESSGTRPSPDSQKSKDQDKAPTASDVNITQAQIQVKKLEQQVEHARQVYQQARDNRMQGEKVRKGSEQNYVRYLERIDKLKQQEQQAKDNLDSLRSTLEDARSRLDKLKEQKAQQDQGAPGAQ